MSIQLRQTADAMIEEAVATTGRPARMSDDRPWQRSDGAAERKARVFGFRRDLSLDTARTGRPASRDLAMA